MHGLRRRSVSVLIVLCLGGLAANAAAQTPAPTPPSTACTINLSRVLATLANAQVDADDGAQDEALEKIAEAQAQLTAIRDACTGTEVALPFDLTETYTAPEDLFTFDYPADWHISFFEVGQDWTSLLRPGSGVTFPRGGTVYAATTPLTRADTMRLSPEEGFNLFVAVGSPFEIFSAAGIFRPEIAQSFQADTFTFETLVETFTQTFQAVESGIEAKIIEDAARPTALFNISDTDFAASIVLVALDEEQQHYAMIIGRAAEAEQERLPALIVGVAATIDAQP